MVISKSCIERLAKDVKQLIKNPLNIDGIYYKHSDDNILQGYALIIGNEDTPYFYGNYIFSFIYPENYPFSPPTVTFLTNDGKMRFNPNFYVNGKVCLSVLNTWNGDGWTSCQTITSILLILKSVLNENPLLNEPGINIKNYNVNKYNTLVSYKNVEYSILIQFNVLQYILEKIEKIKKEDFLEKEKEKNLEKEKEDFLEKEKEDFLEKEKEDFLEKEDKIELYLKKLYTYEYVLYLFRDEIIHNVVNNIDNVLYKLNNLDKKINIYDNIYINTYNLNYNLNINNLKNEVKNIIKKK